jgi:hypothetical protein
MKNKTWTGQARTALVVCLGLTSLSCGVLNRTAPSRSGAAAADLSWQLPSDIPANLTQNDQRQVDEFAWQSFVALSWPALKNMRGEPDTSQQLGASSPVVWETYKRPDEVFLSDGSEPAKWQDWPNVLPEPCKVLGAAASTRVLTMNQKKAIAAIKQAVGGTLTDQLGRLARYEIAFNQIEYDYIVGNRFYNAADQRQATSISFEPGSVEIKAAWREMAGVKTPERYYRISAYVYDASTQDCTLKDMGLVGLHIIQKTSNVPHWIWATFEQVDNVDDSSEADPSFNDPTCPSDECRPNTSTEKCGKPTSTPTQVIRLVPISGETKSINQEWQDRLKSMAPNSPWMYYRLIGAQWQLPSKSGQPIAPLPNTLANVTMETYNQTDSSCMSCHNGAVGIDGKTHSDFSFVLDHARTENLKAGATP